MTGALHRQQWRTVRGSLLSSSAHPLKEPALERLEQEVNDLRRRDAELEQLSHTQDHIQFLQSFQSLSAPPESTDVNDDLFSSLNSSDALRESVHQLRDKLEDFWQRGAKKSSNRETLTNIAPRTRKDFLQYIWSSVLRH
ncbi:hypothetical protein cypCar_00045862 [Cyprinus carpio]|nr:hypothetical protein cypCar_00045862 [Cyprinus carpio]